MALHRAVLSVVFLGAAGGSDELRAAQATIRRSHHLYQAFTEGAPILATPANIENLNYLQCSWSLGAIYSNRKDFAFARRVFRKSPQYRSVPRTSVMEKGRILVPAEDDAESLVFILSTVNRKTG
jgi:hypothetical protein